MIGELSLIEGSERKHRESRVSEKVALSLRDRKRDQEEAWICRITSTERQALLVRSRHLSRSDRATFRPQRHSNGTAGELHHLVI